MADPTFVMGIQVQLSALAVTHAKRVELTRHPIHKRRRNWGVKVTWQDTPAIFKVGDHTLICHPSIYEELVSAASGEKCNG